MIIDVAVLPSHIAEQVMTCQEPIYFAKDGKVLNSVSSAPSYAKGDFNFDLERMQGAIQAPRVRVPTGKTPEELLAWLDNLTDSDFVE